MRDGNQIIFLKSLEVPTKEGTERRPSVSLDTRGTKSTG